MVDLFCDLEVLVSYIMFFTSLIHVVCEMAPYLLLGFFIAGVLHVFVPQRFYANYLSPDNKLSVLWAALLGVPLPLCSCGVIPTAIGLRNEKASKGAIASFLIATPARQASTLPLRQGDDKRECVDMHRCHHLSRRNHWQECRGCCRCCGDKRC